MMIKEGPRFPRKKIRCMSTVVGIYQVIISHFALFIILLGLAHAEQVNSILYHDIVAENEMIENTVVPNSEGDYINQIRFKSAQELAYITLMMLYLLTLLIIPYACSCVILLYGVIRCRPRYMVPWLIMNCICGVTVIALLLFGGFFKVNNCERLLCLAMASIIGPCEFTSWFIIRYYYGELSRSDKLVESATVKIPFHYRKENIYLGKGGYKHHLTDPLVDEPSLTM